MKEEKLWSIKYDGRILWWLLGRTRKQVKESATDWYDGTWECMKEDGYRVVRVKIEEVG